MSSEHNPHYFIYVIYIYTLIHCSNGYNILLHGLGSKRTLLEDFRRSELKDLDHVVVNGYFPSLTIKHVSVYTLSHLELNMISLCHRMSVIYIKMAGGSTN